MVLVFVTPLLDLPTQEEQFPKKGYTTYKPYKCFETLLLTFNINKS